MPTPSDLVTDAFAQAQSYASNAQASLTKFTDQLNAAIQNVPLVDVAFDPIPDPGASTVPDYVAPADYTSSLLTTLADTLATRLAGGTGLSDSVEAGIWDRARERELAASQAAIDDASYSAEALGFVLPPGVLADGIRRETRAYYDKVSTISREVAIKQADLEQANMQKAIEQATGYEDTLSQILTRRSQLTLDAFRAEVDKFRAEVEQDVKHWEVAIKQYEAQTMYVLNASRLNTEVARANLATVLEAAKTGAQVYAQLTASAYSLIHASAAVSASAADSVSYSYSNDTESAAPTVTSI